MADGKKSRIRVTCPCGQKFTCRRNRIGKTVYCNRCCSSFAVEKPAEVATVPDPESSKKNELEKSGPRYCPQCDSMAFRDSQKCPDCDCDYVSGEAVGPTPVASTIGMSILLAATFASIGQVGFRLDGPEFLGFYLILMTTCWIGAEVLRTFTDYTAAQWVAAFILVAAGAIRIYQGIQAGMHRFGLLIELMLVGAVLIVLGSRKIDPNCGLLSRFAIPVTCILGLGLLVGVFIAVEGYVVGLLTLFSAFVPVFVSGGLSNRSGSGYYTSYSSGGGGCGGGGCGGGGCGGCGG